jgi:hypothetical protein
MRFSYFLCGVTDHWGELGFYIISKVYVVWFSIFGGLIFAVLICFDVGVENFEIVHPRF